MSTDLDIEALRKAAAEVEGWSNVCHVWQHECDDTYVIGHINEDDEKHAAVTVDTAQYYVEGPALAHFYAKANPATILALLDERRALLDRMERAEARALPDFAEYDAKAGTISLFGIKYTADLFQEFGATMPLGELFSIKQRADGVLTVCRAQAAAGAVPEGFALVPIHATNAITCAIERQIDSQLTASGMDANAMFRQDGDYVWDAAIAAALAAAPPAQGLPAAPTHPSAIGFVMELQSAQGGAELGLHNVKTRMDTGSQGGAGAAPSEPVARKLSPRDFMTPEQRADYESGHPAMDHSAAFDAYLRIATPPAQDAGTGAIVEAALVWWKWKRPISWTAEQHREQFQVNCPTDCEINLARAIANSGRVE